MSGTVFPTGLADHLRYGGVSGLGKTVPIFRKGALSLVVNFSVSP